MEDPTDRPIFDPGDIVESPNGDLCVRIIEHIGEGRCCMVYSAKTLRDNAKVALKVFKKGSSYDGAVQREQYILDLFNESKHNIGKKFPVKSQNNFLKFSVSVLVTAVNSGLQFSIQLAFD